MWILHGSFLENSGINVSIDKRNDVEFLIGLEVGSTLVMGTGSWGEFEIKD